MNNIPLWLQNSELYQSGEYLKLEDLNICELCDITDDYEFDELLQIIEQWKVHKPYPLRFARCLRT